MTIRPGPAADPNPSPEPGVTPDTVHRTSHHYHVQLLPTETFVEFRTPLSSPETPTTLVVPGCDLREGRLPTGEWLVESVKIPVDAAADGDEAERLARQVVEQHE